MPGLGRSVAGGNTQLFEYLRIEARDGQLAYVASPLGGGTTDFALREAVDERAIFENPAHGSKRHMERCWSRVVGE